MLGEDDDGFADGSPANAVENRSGVIGRAPPLPMHPNHAAVGIARQWATPALSVRHFSGRTQRTVLAGREPSRADAAVFQAGELQRIRQCSVGYAYTFSPTGEAPAGQPLIKKGGNLPLVPRMQLNLLYTAAGAVPIFQVKSA